jgi:hypothetical protein
VASTTPGSPWDQPFDVDLFRLNVRDTAIARQTAGNCLANCYSGGNVTDMGNSQYGGVGFPQVTYIEGNAEMGGDISGAGILMVYGNLIWNGTPNFQGLIVVLGGEFEVIGGGTGGNHAGSVVTLNLQTGELGLEYGPSTFDVTGGGVAQFNFDCDALWAAPGMLDDAGQHLWSPECDTGPETPFDAGPEEMIIASWRENIGWREDFFGSEEE